ncbi:hypothetical protein BCV72DRAFT_261846 [Rhizopus microsporus var. microsporus]|uniref:Galactose oxidase n=1 Tax=Rhizopus microsporus var. microsporus TaxID=86635 RepID=A0A1X0R7E3_RHIZD|nr:hypothetical protein BCV72DRAFT_261846 [Rhizopus microsporus var. microsporus]
MNIHHRLMLFISWCYVFVATVAAISLPERLFPACVYLNRNIYCYGGDQGGTSAGSIVYALSLDSSNPVSIKDMNVNWTQVPIKNSFDPEARQKPQFVALSDNKRFVINGGSHFGSTPIRNHSIVFDVQNNTWQKLPDFPGENNTRSEGTAVSIPSAIDDTIVLFGGKLLKRNVVEMTVPYVNSTMYNISSGTWAYLKPQLNIPIASTPIGQSTTFNPKSGIIYYFGGKTCSVYNIDVFFGFPFNNDYKNCTLSSLTWGYIFDTKKAIWDRNNYTASTGSRFPSRRQHLTTVLASDFQHIIMYGGENDKQAVSDFMYTLDLNNNTWTQVKVEANGSSLTRAAHSAVLVNTTLFILFGKDNSNTYAATMLAYNVTDLLNIRPIDYYYSDTISTNTTLDQPSPLTSSAPHSDIEPLSAGAKAGIAVGSIVGSMKYMQPSVQDPDEQVMDEINDLDWNNIERQYFELDTLSTTAVAESLYRNSTDQQVLSPNANTNSTYTVLKTTETSQISNVEITHTMEDSAQTPDASTHYIKGLSQTPDAVTK